MKIKNLKLKIGMGFTLLEVLVVISIIGIVIGLASVSYSTSQKKARDAKRTQDLKNIQNAFEQYYSICGYVYPVALPAVDSPITCVATGDVFLEKTPGDPKSGLTYAYAGDASSYTITATAELLEDDPYVKNLQ